MTHQLLVNQAIVLVAFQPIAIPNVRCDRWLVFQEALAPAIHLIPDAYVELQTAAGIRPMFLEVDRGTESQSV